jgi:hypothetical protein
LRPYRLYRDKVAKVEAVVPENYLSLSETYAFTENGASMDEGVELAVLATGVDTGWEF